MEAIDEQCDYYSLSEVVSDTYGAIKAAFMANDNNIYVIKAQTSVGKSTSFLELISQNPDSKILVAAPTNLLKEELKNKAEEKGIKIEMTPSLDSIMDEIPHDLQENINYLYDCGLAKRVYPLIEETLKNEDIPCLKEHMKARKRLRTYKGSLITTHRYLLSMEDKRLDEFDCIIVDEDIIFKSVISNQGEIKVSTLKKLLHKTSDPMIRNKITDLLEQSNHRSCIYSKGFQWEYESESDPKLQINIPAFCAAEYFCFRSAKNEQNLDEDVFSFIKPFSLSEKRKYIIVSATADEEIYRSFLGKDRIRFYECKQARYQGELLQYYKKSMSRSCIERNAKIIGRIQQKLNIDDSHVITFKKEDIGALHFGNTEGSNTLEGEDILVIGTPYHAEFLYKLTAFSLGIRFDENEKVKTQEVVRNGYRTTFTTFENEDLRAIQFWMLESELEQAVGRARLLRNACTVHLFSNYPLRQAKMIEDFNC
jgi:hypothetical protein